MDEVNPGPFASLGKKSGSIPIKQFPNKDESMNASGPRRRREPLEGGRNVRLMSGTVRVVTAAATGTGAFHNDRRGTFLSLGPRGNPHSRRCRCGRWPRRYPARIQSRTGPTGTGYSGVWREALRCFRNDLLPIAHDSIVLQSNPLSEGGHSCPTGKRVWNIQSGPHRHRRGYKKIGKSKLHGIRA